MKNETDWGEVIVYYRDEKQRDAIERAAEVSPASSHSPTVRLPNHGLSWRFNGKGGLDNARDLKKRLLASGLIGLDVRLCGAESA